MGDQGQVAQVEHMLVEEVKSDDMLNPFGKASSCRCGGYPAYGWHDGT